MQGVYGVNNEGSGDMYDKGQLVLNTLRSSIDNDSLWFSVLRGIQTRFRYKTISYDSIVSFVSEATGKDYRPFFDQYYRHSGLPRLDAYVAKRGDSTSVRYRWSGVVPGFSMPVRITTGDGTWRQITPTTTSQYLMLGPGADPWSFKIDEERFYCDPHIVRTYLDPRAPSSLWMMF